MEYRISNPSPELSGFVKHYWAIENCIPAGQQHVQRIVPSGMAELIFYLGDRPVSADRKREFSENTVLSGQSNTYYDLKITGKLSLFSILFRPHGLSAFFDIPASGLFNQNVPLRFIFKDRVGELEEKLAETPAFEEKKSVVESFLTERIRKTKPCNHFRRIGDSIRLINHSNGQAAIGFLATEACFSRKQYERTFSEITGITPGQFLKIVRFQQAIRCRSTDRNSGFAALACQCGYYDQSHMNRDFLSLSGLTPKQFFADCEPFSDYFQ
jgi:AraC-like DNA-binding protein